jgi:hypothetical protein
MRELIGEISGNVGIMGQSIGNGTPYPFECQTYLSFEDLLSLLTSEVNGRKVINFIEI